jgi:hypothetical protein
MPLIVCLALSAGIVAIWVRSYFVADRYRSVDYDETANTLTARRMSIVTGLGGLNFSCNYERTSAPGHRELLRQNRDAYAQANPPRFSSTRQPRYPMRIANEDSILTSLGFSWFYLPERLDDGATYRRRMALTVPIWSIFTLAMTYPFGLYVAGVIQRQREDRLALGLCPRCGCAVKDGSDRCPGCDRPVPAGLVRHA